MWTALSQSEGKFTRPPEDVQLEIAWPFRLNIKENLNWLLNQQHDQMKKSNEAQGDFQRPVV